MLHKHAKECVNVHVCLQYICLYTHIRDDFSSPHNPNYLDFIFFGPTFALIKL